MTHLHTVASVEDVESHLQTQELVEVSVAPKPITMTRAEIYAMHNTLRKELDLIVSLSVLYIMTILKRRRIRTGHFQIRPPSPDTGRTGWGTQCPVSRRTNRTCHVQLDEPLFCGIEYVWFKSRCIDTWLTLSRSR
jgi:hypothetical protein